MDCTIHTINQMKYYKENYIKKKFVNSEKLPLL